MRGQVAVVQNYREYRKGKKRIQRINAGLRMALLEESVKSPIR
jgi:hypothetical protein